MPTVPASSDPLPELDATGVTRVQGEGVVHEHSSGAALVFAVRAGRGDLGGADVVAACVDGLLAAGALPADLRAEVCAGDADAEDLAAGLERGCRAHGFAWGGANVQPGALPQVRAEATGRIARALPGAVAGDVLFGCGATSLHDVGFAHAHSALCDAGLLDARLPEAASTGRQLLLAQRKPCYGPVFTLLQESRLNAYIPVGPGGVRGSLRRALGAGLVADLDLGAWPRPELMAWLERALGGDPASLADAFTLGLGQVLAVPPQEAEYVAGLLQAWNELHWRIGKVMAV